MKRSAKWMGLAIFLAVVLAGPTLLAQPAPRKLEPAAPGVRPGEKGQCCVAGTYDGVHTDIRSRTCPRPESGKFIMHIEQDKRCGSRIWGQMIDPVDKTTMKLEGVVKPGPKQCCKIKGRLTRPGEWVEFEGTLCKRRGKWICADGAYTSSSGCSGKFKMYQR